MLCKFVRDFVWAYKLGSQYWGGGGAISSINKMFQNQKIVSEEIIKSNNYHDILSAMFDIIVEISTCHTIS